jgi:hypothetical protein
LQQPLLPPLNSLDQHGERPLDRRRVSAARRLIARIILLSQVTRNKMLQVLSAGFCLVTFLFSASKIVVVNCSEDLPRSEMVVGDFSSTPAGLSELNVRVTSPVQTTLFSKPSCSEGKFAFTTSAQGEYQFCYENLGLTQKQIKVDLKTGVHAKDYSSVAKKDHLKPIEVELRRLEDIVQSVHEDMNYLRSREEEMRNTNGLFFSLSFSTLTYHTLVSALLTCVDVSGFCCSDSSIDNLVHRILICCFRFDFVAESTNSRVLWFSIMSMVILVALGAWQLIYLRRFFQSKKMI